MRAVWCRGGAVIREEGRIYLTSSEVAPILRVSAKTITRWGREGRLPHFVTLGGHRRYDLRTLKQVCDRLGLPFPSKYETMLGVIDRNP